MLSRTFANTRGSKAPANTDSQTVCRSYVTYKQAAHALRVVSALHLSIHCVLLTSSALHDPRLIQGQYGLVSSTVHCTFVRGTLQQHGAIHAWPQRIHAVTRPLCVLLSAGRQCRTKERWHSRCPPRTGFRGEAAIPLQSSSSSSPDVVAMPSGTAASQPAGLPPPPGCCQAATLLHVPPRTASQVVTS